MNVTPERVALAARAAVLRQQGLTLVVIAGRLGISRSYASELICDPDASKRAARRVRYEGTCERCSAVTKSNGTSKPSPRCQTCGSVVNGENQREWTPEKIIAAIQWWNAAYGEPPATTDWNDWSALNDYGDPARAERYRQLHAQGRVPQSATAVRVFGSWNAAIQTAGFEPREPGIVANRHRLRRNRKATA